MRSHHLPHFSLETIQGWMQEAMTLAQQALPHDVPVGALVLDSHGQVIGRGYNTREQQNDPLGHAELNALKQATQHLGNWRLNGCTLVVTLEPCPMCASALAQSKLARIIYGASDPLQGACGGAAGIGVYWPTPPEMMGGVLEASTTQQLNAVFRGLRRTSA